MKVFSVLFLAIILPLTGHSQFGQRRCPYRYSHNILTISPTIGGNLGYFVFDNDKEVNYGYYGGLLIDVRPIRPLSLEMGLLYNQINDFAEFYSTPLIFNLHTRNNIVFFAGPLLLFDTYTESLNLNSPLIGYSLGVKLRSFMLSYSGLPKDIFHHPKGNELKVAGLLGVHLQLQIRLFHVRTHLSRYSW